MLSRDELVTVAIPVYNGSKYLEHAVNSIVQQSFPIKYITIIDDASTDNIDEVIKHIREKYIANNLTYYRNENNIGYPSNWNLCFKYCVTKYLIILHQDDLLLPESVEKQLKFFQEHQDIALVGGLEDFIDETGNIIKKNKRKDDMVFQQGQIYEFVSKTGSYIPCSSVMFDMHKIKKIGYFDEDVLASDELFWPKVLKNYPIAIIGEALIYRRIHPGQTEYEDFITKYNKIVEASRAQYRIAEYEEDLLKRTKTLKILKEKTARNSIRIAVKVLQMQKNFNLFIKYLKVAFQEYPKIFFSKFFIKYIINVILGKIL